MNYKQIIARLKEHQNYVKGKIDASNEPFWQIFFVGLRGVQNYGLDVDDSLVSSLAVVVPSRQYAFEKRSFSDSYELENGEKIIAIDINTFVDQLFENNITAIEVLASEYYVVEQDVFADYKEELSQYVLNFLYRDPTSLNRIVCTSISNLYNILKKSDNYNGAAWAELYRQYYWLVRYKYDDLYYANPFSMKKCDQLYEYYKTYMYRTELLKSDIEILLKKEKDNDYKCDELRDQVGPHLPRRTIAVNSWIITERGVRDWAFRVYLTANNIDKFLKS